MKKLLLLLLNIILLTSLTNAQGIDRSKFVKDSIDSYIVRALTNWRIPGVAVCIIKDNKVVLMKGYGIKELGLNNKVDINTLFMIGSNTKAFTATALAMLQTGGKLSLDDKVSKYIPGFKLDDKFASEEVNLTDLLSHRIGFATFQGDFTFYNTNLTRNQIIEKMGHVKAAYPFRTKWGYANSAYLTAGEIIPRAAGKSWEAYLRDNIFAPLGMINTLALTADMPKSLDKTVPHTLVNGQLTAIPYCQIDGLAPAASICTSVNDMSKWVMALLNDGKVGNRQIIPPDAIQATRQPQDIVGYDTHLNGKGSYELYGMGWFLEDYLGHGLVMHDGDVNGYLSSVTLVPKEHLGVIILTNTDQNEFFEALRWEVMDAYFKMPFFDYSTKYLALFKMQQDKKIQVDRKMRDSVALNLKPTLLSGQYTGKYVNDLYGSLTVTQGENNDLEVRFEHHPKMFAHLQPLGGNRFYATFSDPVYGKAVFPFIFQSGKITGIRVKVDDEVEATPYDFKKVD